MPGCSRKLWGDAVALTMVRGVGTVNTNGKSRIPVILKKNERALLAAWVDEQTAGGSGEDRIQEGELREQSREFLRLLQEAAQDGSLADGDGPAWQRVREMLAGLSISPEASRAIASASSATNARACSSTSARSSPPRVTFASDAVQSTRMCASCSRRIDASRLRWSTMVRSCSRKD